MDSFVSARSDFSSFYSAASHHAVSAEDLHLVLESDAWRSLFQGSSRRPTAHSSPASHGRRCSTSSVCQNLLDVRKTRVFFWCEDQNAVITVDVQEAELQRTTALECDFSPLFEVNSIVVSPGGASVLLVGQRGLSVLDVGPEENIPEAGRKIARCIAISERFFLNNPKITVVQCEWFPSRETHLAVLTSDSCLRFYRISSPSQPDLVVNLHGAVNKRSLHNFSAFAIVPTIEDKNGACPDGSTATVYALRTDGNVWTFDVSAGNEKIIGSSLTGPLLANAPFTSDMSQVATSIVCVQSVVPVILIASNKHQILHGILLDKDEADMENESRGLGVLTAKQELLFIERLELTTSSRSQQTRMPVSAKLLHCKTIPACYAYATERQIIGVAIPWLDDLSLLVKDEIDMVSLRQSVVRTVASLDPSAEADEVALITQRMVPSDSQSCLILSIATNGQVTIHNLRSVASSNQRQEFLLDPSMILPQFTDSQEFARRVKPSNEVPFDEFIENILRRDKSFPSFMYSNSDHLSSEELQDVVAQGMDVFREQYYDRQRTALEELNIRHSRNEARKKQLLKLLDDMENRAEDTNRQFANYMDHADYLENEAVELQARISSLQAEFSRANPVVTDAEKQLMEKLQSLESRMESVEELLLNVHEKLSYRERRIQEGGEVPLSVLLAQEEGDSSHRSRTNEELSRIRSLQERIKELTSKLNG
ncbi:hypothetical protein RvY_08091-2 [Ramazzottius varieornatus]|nr:hypothetical protein RvY_08091-2 [Ramazzottius varieornatus]